MTFCSSDTGTCTWHFQCQKTGMPTGVRSPEGKAVWECLEGEGRETCPAIFSSQLQLQEGIFHEFLMSPGEAANCNIANIGNSQVESIAVHMFVWGNCIQNGTESRNFHLVRSKLARLWEPIYCTLCRVVVCHSYSCSVIISPLMSHWTDVSSLK